MAFRIVPFEPWHLFEIEIQEPGINLSDWYGGDYASLANGLSYTAIDDRVLGASGILPWWPGRDHAWILLGDCGPGNFLRIHREVKRQLEARGTRRTEMWVNPDYAPGVRWAEMLGFINETKETHMRSFTPDGRTFDLYARVLDE